MLVDPQQLWLAHNASPISYAGGRAIEEYPAAAAQLLQRVGSVFELEYRHWTVRQFFLPHTRDRTVRAGVRALVADEWGFIGFVNQRDLELLLGVKKPREWCHWLGQSYPDIDSASFYGVCSDPVDLLDELHAHELELRRQYGMILPGRLSYTRQVHKERGIDVIQELVFLQDYDPNTGMIPDPRRETIEQRWVRAEEVRQEWR